MGCWRPHAFWCERVVCEGQGVPGWGLVSAVYRYSCRQQGDCLPCNSDRCVAPRSMTSSHFVLVVTLLLSVALVCAPGVAVQML